MTVNPILVFSVCFFILICIIAQMTGICASPTENTGNDEYDDYVDFDDEYSDEPEVTIQVNTDFVNTSEVTESTVENIQEHPENKPQDLDTNFYNDEDELTEELMKLLLDDTITPIDIYILDNILLTNTVLNFSSKKNTEIDMSLMKLISIKSRNEKII